MYSSRQSKKTNKQRARKPLRLLVFILIVLILGVGAYLFINRDEHAQRKAQTSSTDEQKQPEPPKETSEGQTFPIPEDLPEDAIKNYALVTENDEYKIRRLEGTNKYIITLYAIINNPDQYQMYQDQLKEYKQKALDYLKSKGVDISKIEATYEPDEAKNI